MRREALRVVKEDSGGGGLVVWGFCLGGGVVCLGVLVG